MKTTYNYCAYLNGEVISFDINEKLNDIEYAYCFDEQFLKDS